MKLKTGLLILFLLAQTHSLFAASPTAVLDTLSNPQLSYFGRLDTGVNPGDSILRIITSGTPPSITTNNLFVGDTVTVGTGTTYTIKDVGNTAQIQINTGINVGDAYYGAPVLIPRYAIHTITFTPQSNITGGYWQFLIKASSTAGENQQDGVPDQNGFDIGAVANRIRTTDITCPNFGAGTAAYNVGTTTIVNGNSYHIITCSLGTGNTNGIGVSYSVNIGADLLTSGRQIINPAPQSGHSEGNADVYTFFIRHLDSSENVVNADTVQGKIAVVDSVRVTATIDPTLTFMVDATGVGVGATPCGLSGLGGNAANTTATAVAYGSVSLINFNDLAQRLSCTTNSKDGYIVTVYEDGPMHNISNGTTIPDTNCDGSCSATVPAAWSTNNGSEWGYTIQNINVGTTIFSYLSGYKAFGNGPGNAQTIMSNNGTPATTERAYTCYRLTASTSQEAGNYENRLVYTATATF